MRVAGETVAVIMTCHNRKALTLASIEAVAAAGVRAAVRLSVYLTDDASTDGTAAAVRARWPGTTIVEGDGSLYWNRGMLRAWSRAAEDRPDFYLWLNDDLAVFQDALAAMLTCYDDISDPKAIVVGRTVDPESGATTYGAYARAPGWSRLRFRHLCEAGDRAVTMNGNFVLIPASAVADVGMNNPCYRHHSGDVDYGLRAAKAGYSILECPKPVGRQTRNAAFDERASRMTLKTTWRALTDPKGVGTGEWLTFTRAHGGLLWPVNFIYRYAKMLTKGYFKRV